MHFFLGGGGGEERWGGVQSTMLTRVGVLKLLLPIDLVYCFVDRQSNSTPHLYLD